MLPDLRYALRIVRKFLFHGQRFIAINPNLDATRIQIHAANLLDSYSMVYISEHEQLPGYWKVEDLWVPERKTKKEVHQAKIKVRGGKRRKRKKKDLTNLLE